ncbi:hypothetical protein H257_05074 [Aphanomyces astaci]|uniref:Uncharacterized protein n=1 Tax=Aphanomyces astaci TaxID=112090 RepID=W4GSW8_APHAT|nr:hypothetical protein H257_05074 [Aphanomyces astaci]ETV82436.1 hypothetical protein H257_05074 [Aphanomyces astaci]|eukprot:XP_009828105.1 hypothetical protein H257_05074 [Aphanomyces astaci]
MSVGNQLRSSPSPGCELRRHLHQQNDRRDLSYNCVAPCDHHELLPLLPLPLEELTILVPPLCANDPPPTAVPVTNQATTAAPGDKFDGNRNTCCWSGNPLLVPNSKSDCASFSSFVW